MYFNNATYNNLLLAFCDCICHGLHVNLQPKPTNYCDSMITCNSIFHVLCSGLPCYRGVLSVYAQNRYVQENLSDQLPSECLAFSQRQHSTLSHITVVDFSQVSLILSWNKSHSISWLQKKLNELEIDTGL